MTSTGEWAAGPGWRSDGLQYGLKSLHRPLRPGPEGRLGQMAGLWLWPLLSRFRSVNVTPIPTHHRMLRPFITGCVSSSWKATLPTFCRLATTCQPSAA